jgi:hypothetical protein
MGSAAETMIKIRYGDKLSQVPHLHPAPGEQAEASLYIHIDSPLSSPLNSGNRVVSKFNLITRNPLGVGQFQVSTTN